MPGNLSLPIELSRYTEVVKREGGWFIGGGEMVTGDEAPLLGTRYCLELLEAEEPTSNSRWSTF